MEVHFKRMGQVNDEHPLFVFTIVLQIATNNLENQTVTLEKIIIFLNIIEKKLFLTPKEI